MKRALITSLILIIILLTACTPQIVKDGGTAEYGTPLPTAYIEDAYKDSTIVYVTESGTKYHNKDCLHLSDSNIPISLAQAKKYGYDPCSVCEPPS